MLRSLLWRPRSIRVPVNSGTVDIQRVEVTKQQSQPLFGRMFTSFFLGYCVVRTTSWLLSDEVRKTKTVVNDELDKARKTVATKSNTDQFGDKWNEQNKRITAAQPPPKNAITQSPQDEAQSFNLMLPIWFRRRQQMMYIESDPEWKEIAKLQQDKKKCLDLKRNVANAILGQIATSQHLPNLRFIQFAHQMNVHLDIVPSLYPPPSYEVPCVSIDVNEVAVGWRRVPEAVGAKMERIFHPVIFSTAVYIGLREFTTASYAITKARFIDGINKTRGVSNDQRGGPLGLSLPTEEQKVVLRFPSARFGDKDMQAVLPFLRGEFGQEGEKRKYRDMVKLMTYSAAIEHACAEFNKAWITRQFSALQQPPRGACQIRGHIDFVGARGKYRLQVMAIYSPADDSIIGRPAITGAHVVADLPKWTAKKAELAKIMSPKDNPKAITEQEDEDQPSDPPEGKPSSDKEIEK